MWTELTGHETGGSPILSYHLQWDAGTNEADWYDLIGEDGNYYLDTSYILTTDVNPGDTYKVRVRANNLHGWGDWSDPSIILSTGTPDQPDPPATAINNLSIRISWENPDHNFEAIDLYQILIKHKTGDAFSEEVENCDGSN